MKINHKVVVLGCGNGGMALAADLKLKGADVALWSDADHSTKLNKIIKCSNEIVLHEEKASSTAKLDLVTTDLAEAVKFRGIIFNCTPMDAHVSIFKQLVDLIDANNLTFIINLSGIYSSIDQFLHGKNLDIFFALKVFDTASFPYACRAGNDNEVRIFARKTSIAIAPLFSVDYDLLNLISDTLNLIPFKKVAHTLMLGLMGTNAILHPASVLFNARLIDQGNSFEFYKEGISKNTSLFHEALDNERLSLAKAMGYKISSCAQDYSHYYDKKFKNIYDFNMRSLPHRHIKAPHTLSHRFVTEDIGYALVPLLTLGKIFNVSMPNIESLVTIFSTIMEVDFCRKGRNLRGLTRDLIEVFSQPNCSLNGMMVAE